MYHCGVVYKYTHMCPSCGNMIFTSNPNTCSKYLVPRTSYMYIGTCVQVRGVVLQQYEVLCTRTHVRCVRVTSILYIVQYTSRYNKYLCTNLVVLGTSTHVRGTMYEVRGTQYTNYSIMYYVHVHSTMYLVHSTMSLHDSTYTCTR